MEVLTGKNCGSLPRLKPKLPRPRWMKPTILGNARGDCSKIIPLILSLIKNKCALNGTTTHKGNAHPGYKHRHWPPERRIRNNCGHPRLENARRSILHFNHYRIGTSFATHTQRSNY